MVNKVSTESGTKQIVAKHPKAFNGGLGILPGKVHLELRDDVAPVVCPPRKVPIALRQKVKDDLDQLKKLVVIEEVDEPTN